MKAKLPEVKKESIKKTEIKEKKGLKTTEELGTVYGWFIRFAFCAYCE